MAPEDIRIVLSYENDTISRCCRSDAEHERMMAQAPGTAGQVKLTLSEEVCHMKLKKLAGLAAAFALTLALIPVQSAFADTEDSDVTVLTFSDSQITETVPGSGYKISKTELTIKETGTYRITGSCSEGSIVVAKGVEDVTLILDDLTLSASSTAPLVIKKNSTVTIILEGENTLSDNEDPADEDSEDADTADAYEGAAIKVKSGSSLVMTGSGTLNISGNAKNGIKGASETSLVIGGGTYNVTAANNGIAFDGSIEISAGTINVASGNDGIKAVPDEDDTASAGTITITGGSITIDADGDGIQAGTDLTITGGTFNIRTLDGYSSTSFDKYTMSCKGLKASGDIEDVENYLTITGGVFTLNTADDAIHSDAYAQITGGTFYIYTGDDGVHADTSLILGSEDGYERDPYIIIYASYEGLEAGTIYTYSGKYYVTASDDGINAAGGSSNGSDPGAGAGRDSFNPGGGFGGRTGFPGSGSGAGMGGFGTVYGGQAGQNAGQGTSSGDYAMYFYGGSFYVNCTGDGLDANGDIYLYGGTFTVLSQASGGDNSPLDADGNMIIKGASVFAAGTNSMNETPSSSSQKYYSAKLNAQAGTVINISLNGSIVSSEKLVRNINYLLYSSPELTSSNISVSTATSVTACSGFNSHSWDGGIVESAASETLTGVIKYTCTVCGAVERQTLAATGTGISYDADYDENNGSEGDAEDDITDDGSADDGASGNGDTDTAADNDVNSGSESTEKTTDIIYTEVDGESAWWYFSDGEADRSYTGFADNKNGRWRIEDGKVDFSYNDIVFESGEWRYYYNGMFQSSYTGVTDCANAYGWWYVKDGRVDFMADTVAANKNGWWKVAGGRVDFGFTGLAPNENGWWYIKDGRVDFSYNGFASNSNGIWLVMGGKVAFNRTGVVKYGGAEYTVTGGKVVS